ncbi:MAG: hypothetical protein ABI420_08940 [Opitutaceae bacterium]
MTHSSSSQHGGAVFKLVVVLAVVFAGLALAWMLLLPVVLTSQLRQRTGFDATVQSLTVNPFTGSVKLRGLIVTNPPTFPVNDFIEVREFQSKLELLSVLSDQVVFTSILIDVPSVTLVKREAGSNAEAFQNHLTLPAGAKPEPPSTKPAKRFLIRHLTLRLGRVVVADYSGRTPVNHEYKLDLDQNYTDVTSVNQLLAPAALQSLAPVAAALGGLLPGNVGHMLNEAAKDAAKGGTTLIKNLGNKVEEKAKGFFDALEESKKP